MSLVDLLFPQSSPNRCKKVTKNKLKQSMAMVNFCYEHNFPNQWVINKDNQDDNG